MPTSPSSRYCQADELDLPGVPVDREPAPVDGHDLRLHVLAMDRQQAESHLPVARSALQVLGQALVHQVPDLHAGELVGDAPAVAARLGGDAWRWVWPITTDVANLMAALSAVLPAIRDSEICAR